MAEEQTQTKADDVVKSILERAGYETEGEEGFTALTDLPMPIHTHFCWFPAPGSGKTNPTLLEVGAAVPLGPNWSGMTIFSIYVDEDELRVYAVAVASSKKPLPPHRFTLSMEKPIFGVEMMDLDVFIGEMAAELEALSEDEEEEEEVVQTAPNGQETQQATS
jgi:hypothetical protein